MVDGLSILYYTANRERPEFEARIRAELLRAADGLPIVSVVQDPADPGIGRCICVGPVGASYRNCYRQVLVGAQAAETEFVALAEADTLYPAEFFQAVPPDGVDAWIGNNLWVLYADDPGRYVHKGPSDGLLVARRDWLIERLQLRLAKLPGWGPGKTRPIVGRNADMEKFDHPPVVNVKTGASLMPTTPHQGVYQAVLDGWGSAADLAQMFDVTPTVPRVVAEPPVLRLDRGPDSLDVLIPAANEEFLARTVADILEHAEGDTNVIVVLDGYLSDPPLAQHPRVTVIYNGESVGQRAATNQAARVSDARYLMKLDAHCAMDQGFDVKMTALMEPDITMVPTLYNLHVFDWVCPNGHRRYQGQSVPCFDCGEPVAKEMVWKPRLSRKTNAMRFDRDLRFGYWGEYEARQGDGPLVETMSLLGACWMLTRERYWALNICDEVGFPSWGQQGSEVACKTWLTGGRLLVNTTTWFAHCFRTQGGDFGHPYPNPQDAVERARAYSKRLWLDGEWQGKYPLSWLIERFWPVPGWDEGDLTTLRETEASVVSGAFISVASDADSLLSPVLALPGSALAQGVSLTAGIEPTEGHVLGVGDRTQMDGVAASAISAEVVEFEATRNRADEPSVGEAMYANPLPIDAALSLSTVEVEAPVSGLLPATRPVPASGFSVKSNIGKETPDSERVQRGSGVVHGRRIQQSTDKGVVYYTTNRLGVRLARRVQETIRAAGLPIVSASLKPMTGMGVNVHVEGVPGVETMFRQILAALEESRASFVFLCEHDVAYHPSHFQFVPPRDDVFYYNTNVFQLLLDEGRATYVDDRRQTSGLCANRELLVAEYRARVERAGRGESGLRIGFEPGTRDGRSEVWRSEFPNVDLRHGGNLTRTKRRAEDFRNPQYAVGWTVVEAGDVPGWDDLTRFCAVAAT